MYLWYVNFPWSMFWMENRLTRFSSEILLLQKSKFWSWLKTSKFTTINVSPLRPEEHTLDHFWPEKGRLFLTNTFVEQAAKTCEQIISIHCLIEWIETNLSPLYKRQIFRKWNKNMNLLVLTFWPHCFLSNCSHSNTPVAQEYGKVQLGVDFLLAWKMRSVSLWRLDNVVRGDVLEPG